MTDLATFTVQPGTIAARVLAWFADQAPETQVSTGVLADALDQPIALVVTALEPVWEHGLIARERRDGRYYWSTHHPAPRGRHGAPPPVCADEDDIDDFPIVQRVVAAAKQETAIMPTPQLATVSPPPSPKKPRAAPPEFDPLTIELKQRPLPASSRGAGPSRYQVLLQRMKPGQCVDVSPAIAKGLISAAKRAQIKVASRVLSETVTGVWRL